MRQGQSCRDRPQRARRGTETDGPGQCRGTGCVCKGHREEGEHTHWGSRAQAVRLTDSPTSSQRLRLLLTWVLALPGLASLELKLLDSGAECLALHLPAV